jgi:hypothetical protein
VGLRVRIPLGAWMSICCECVLSEVSASGYSLVQRSPIEYGVSDCDIETTKKRRSRSPWLSSREKRGR